jgi:hypothetical protein
MDLTDQVHLQSGVAQICSGSFDNLAVQKFMPELGCSIECQVLLFGNRHAKQ